MDCRYLHLPAATPREKESHGDRCTSTAAPARRASGLPIEDPLLPSARRTSSSKYPPRRVSPGSSFLDSGLVTAFRGTPKERAVRRATHGRAPAPTSYREATGSSAYVIGGTGRGGASRQDQCLWAQPSGICLAPGCAVSSTYRRVISSAVHVALYCGACVDIVTGLGLPDRKAGDGAKYLEGVRGGHGVVTVHVTLGVRGRRGRWGHPAPRWS
jgi:hypothetical protein